MLFLPVMVWCIQGGRVGWPASVLLLVPLRRFAETFVQADCDMQLAFLHPLSCSNILNPIYKRAWFHLSEPEIYAEGYRVLGVLSWESCI